MSAIHDPDTGRMTTSVPYSAFLEPWYPSVISTALHGASGRKTIIQLVNFGVWVSTTTSSVVGRFRAYAADLHFTMCNGRAYSNVKPSETTRTFSKQGGHVVRRAAPRTS
eukprot:6209463-Pleurochrysis_carterae.AAC.2